MALRAGGRGGFRLDGWLRRRPVALPVPPEVAGGTRAPGILRVRACAAI